MDGAFQVILVLWVCCGYILAEICPPDWNRYGESCYFISNTTMDWYQANRTCTERSRANLAYPTSQPEQDYIWELFQNKFPSTDLWIGCNDIEEEGNWQECPMKSGTNGYANWGDGEPNDQYESDCGLIRLSNNGLWDDYPCTHGLFAVCKLPVCSVRLTPKCLLRHAMEELEKSCSGKGCRSHPQYQTSLIDNCCDDQ
ncbi:perlucin-like protein [Asterias rubens]|uniref:perlucin-like protein n=1 Tax=Asterias rubens TaxID=7604 RepID=UPI00145577CA|nr:perlucin-like protein [Asterias rubens]